MARTPTYTAKVAIPVHRGAVTDFGSFIDMARYDRFVVTGWTFDTLPTPWGEERVYVVSIASTDGRPLTPGRWQSFSLPLTDVRRNGVPV